MCREMVGFTLCGRQYGVLRLLWLLVVLKIVDCPLRFGANEERGMVFLWYCGEFQDCTSLKSEKLHKFVVMGVSLGCRCKFLMD